MAYVKQRRHNRKQTKKLIRRELCLLGKILQEIRRMQREHYDDKALEKIDFSDIYIITKDIIPSHIRFSPGTSNQSPKYFHA